MGRLRDLLLGPEPEPVEASGQPGHFHTSTLQEIILAMELQQGGSQKGALSVPAIYRGSQILSDSMADFPWAAYRFGQHSGTRQTGLPEMLEEQPSIVVNPDPMTSRDDWIRAAVTSLVWRGNAYLLGSDYSEGHPTRVQILNPDDVTVSWANEERTRRSYTWKAETPLPFFAVRHLALNLLPSALTGVGPIQAMASTVQDAIDGREYARDLWTSGGVPTGKLIHPAKLSADEAQTLAEQWDLAHSSKRVTGVLSGGMDYEVLSFSADQLQALQSRAFTVAEIARALGIPAHLLNAATGVAGASGAAMTYQNVVMVWRELLGTTLRPVYGNRIVEAMSSYLPRGQSVQFDYSEFMEDDRASRFNSWKTALDAGFMTVDEVRALEGWGPSAELEAEKEAGRQLAAQIAGGGGSDGDAEPESPDPGE